MEELKNDIGFCKFGLPQWLSSKESACKVGELQKTQVWSPDQEDPLEKEMATYSSILAWEIPWTEERGRLHGVTKQSDTI